MQAASVEILALPATDDRSLKTNRTSTPPRTDAPFGLAEDAQVTRLMSKDLPDFPGKECPTITVVRRPGDSDPIHRHNTHAFIHVLEGSVVVRVEGGKPTPAK